jgi:hypothetical protein
MTLAMDHIDAALKELSVARSCVLSVKNRQVRARADLSQVKAFTYAWIKTHRSHLAEFETEKVDIAFNRILELTEKSTQKERYLGLMATVKAALIELRASAISSNGIRLPRLTAISERAPEFSKLSADPDLPKILLERWAEVEGCISVGAHMAAIVMMGGFLETMILARITRDMKGAFSANAAPTNTQTKKPLPISEWSLDPMIKVAHELKWITRSAQEVSHVLKDFRNYIHPNKQLRHKMRITADDTILFWSVCKSITNQILES